MNSFIFDSEKKCQREYVYVCVHTYTHAYYDMVLQIAIYIYIYVYIYIYINPHLISKTVHQINFLYYKSNKFSLSNDESVMIKIIFRLFLFFILISCWYSANNITNNIL